MARWMAWACAAICLAGCIGPDEGMIGPQGGTLRSTLGVTLTIPPGALDSAQQLRLARLDLTRALRAVDAVPNGVALHQPARLTFEVPAGIDPSTLRLWVHVGRRWEPLSTATYDVRTRTFSAPVPVLTGFALAPLTACENLGEDGGVVPPAGGDTATSNPWIRLLRSEHEAGVPLTDGGCWPGCGDGCGSYDGGFPEGGDGGFPRDVDGGFPGYDGGSYGGGDGGYYGGEDGGCYGDADGGYYGGGDGDGGYFGGGDADGGYYGGGDADGGYFGGDCGGAVDGGSNGQGCGSYGSDGGFSGNDCGDGSGAGGGDVWWCGGWDPGPCPGESECSPPDAG